MRCTPYDVITDRIIQQLERGTVPWRRPWNTAAGMPRNLASGHAYRGINPLLLHSLGYEAQWFVTFRQAKQRGGHVRQGEHGAPVVFWKWHDLEDRDSGEPKRVPVLRYYTVFNVQQCESVAAPAVAAPEREHSPIVAAERIVADMHEPPIIRPGMAGACYSPLEDVVSMPRPEVFDSGEAYYATLFHELTHSTGHTSRLDRGLGEQLAPFGSPDYSREELVAEMGAAFLCGEAGILEPQLPQSAAYIAGWSSMRLHRVRRLLTGSWAARPTSRSSSERS
jgi:antirestriction protein ArdC